MQWYKDKSRKSVMTGVAAEHGPGGVLATQFARAESVVVKNGKLKRGAARRAGHKCVVLRTANGTYFLSSSTSE
jgi:hypothetical protein